MTLRTSVTTLRCQKHSWSASGKRVQGCEELQWTATRGIPGATQVIDTVNVGGSSHLVPTVSLNHLASVTSFREAPNRSLRDAASSC